MTKRTIRAGIIGCGMITRSFHIPALMRFPEVRLEAFSDVNEEWAKDVAERYFAPYFFSDYRDMIGKVDIVIVATPNAYHANISKELLNAGISVLCEKPMGISVSECEEVWEAEKKSEGIFMVAQSRRFASNAMFLKKLIDKNRFGEIRAAEFKLGHSHKQWITRSGFAFKKEQSGGGVLIDQGIHLIDLLVWLCGDSVSVKSATGKDVLGYGMEDTVKAEFTLSGGGAATVLSSRIDEWENVCKIEGTEGWAHFHIDEKSYLHVNSKKIKGCDVLGTLQFKTPLTNIYQDQFEYFIDCVKNKKTPMTNSEEAIKGIRLMNDCYDVMDLTK